LVSLFNNFNASASKSAPACGSSFALPFPKTSASQVSDLTGKVSQTNSMPLVQSFPSSTLSSAQYIQSVPVSKVKKADVSQNRVARFFSSLKNAGFHNVDLGGIGVYCLLLT
jgi:hypothetical protein